MQLATLGPGVKRLEVYVESPISVLSVSTNESYTLDIAAPTSTLRAATTWGALRGLETFTQLVQKVHLRDPGAMPAAAAEAGKNAAAAEAPGGNAGQGSGESWAPAPSSSCSDPDCLCKSHHHRRHRRHQKSTLMVIEEVFIEDSPRFAHRARTGVGSC